MAPGGTSAAYGSSGRRLAVLPAGLAFAATAVLLLPFTLPQTSPKAGVKPEAALVYVRLPAAASPTGLAAPIAIVRPRPEAPRFTAPAVPEQASSLPALDASAPAVVSEPNPLPTQLPVQATATEPPASSPIRMDLSTFKEASRASKSEVRRMAETAGVELGDELATKQDQIATAIAETAKPSCIGPGGSLLTIIVVAYRTVMDECR